MTLDPVLPFNTTSMSVKQLFYLKSKLDVRFNAATLTVTPIALNQTLVVVSGDGTNRYPLRVGRPLTLPLGRITILPSN